MKNVFFVLGMFAILLSGCVQDKDKAVFDGTKAVAQDGFLTHEDPDYKVKVSYPASWKLVSNDQAVFAFQSPKEGANDAFLENVNLMMSDLSGQGTTLESYTEYSIGQLRQALPGFSLVELKADTLAGNSAKRIVFTGSMGGQDLKFMQVFTIKEDISYVLTFTSENGKFDSNVETAAKVFDSFQITGGLRENQPSEKQVVAEQAVKAESTIEPVSIPQQAKSEFSGSWRVYSERIFYDIGGAGALGLPVMRRLEISDDSKWKFGDSNGKVVVSQITDEDWARWGVDAYGPTRKIILEGWNKGTADGPVEEDGGSIDFIWVIYHVEPPLVENAGTVWIKFGK